MSFASDIANDFDVVDDIETVNYQRRSIDGIVTTYTNVSAWPTAIRGGTVGAANAGQIVSDQRRWHIRPSTLAVTPRKTDRIVASSGTWEVISDDVEALGTVYVCTCRKVA